MSDPRCSGRQVYTIHQGEGAVAAGTKRRGSRAKGQDKGVRPRSGVHLSDAEPMMLRRLVRFLLICEPSQRLTARQLCFVMYPDASEVELDDFEEYADAHLHGLQHVDDGTS